MTVVTMVMLLFGLQEEARRKAKEEKEKREYEEYLAMKSEFAIEEEGLDAVMENEVGQLHIAVRFPYKCV